MANCTLTNTWQSLSTILDADYDSTKDYRIHLNEDLRSGEVFAYIASSSTPTTERGSEVSGYVDVVLESGKTWYLKGKFNAVNVYISEVA